MRLVCSWNVFVDSFQQLWKNVEYNKPTLNLWNIKLFQWPIYIPGAHYSIIIVSIFWLNNFQMVQKGGGHVKFLSHISSIKSKSSVTCINSTYKLERKIEIQLEWNHRCHVHHRNLCFRCGYNIKCRDDVTGLCQPQRYPLYVPVR